MSEYKGKYKVGDRITLVDGSPAVVVNVDEDGNVKFERIEPVKDQPSTVNHPPHYQGDGIECIDAIAATGNAEGFCVGNAIKYLWRWRDKGGVEDLKKARWYLDWLIGYLERQG